MRAIGQGFIGAAHWLRVERHLIDIILRTAIIPFLSAFLILNYHQPIMLALVHSPDNIAVSVSDILVFILPFSKDLLTLLFFLRIERIFCLLVLLFHPLLVQLLLNLSSSFLQTHISLDAQLTHLAVQAGLAQVFHSLVAQVDRVRGTAPLARSTTDGLASCIILIDGTLDTHAVDGLQSVRHVAALAL